MSILPSRFHGIRDYLTGILLAMGPWLLGFGLDRWETWLATSLGTAVMAYSLATTYESEQLSFIALPVHRMLATAGGALLVVAPWIFGFKDNAWSLFLFVGLFQIALAVLTHPTGRQAGVPDDVCRSKPAIPRRSRPRGLFRPPVRTKH